MRRGPVPSKSDGPDSAALADEGEGSRLLPSESGRKGREKVAAQPSIEQDDKDRSREDDLRDRKIGVDINDRRELDPERDRVERVRGQCPARVIDQLDHDRMFAVDQV